MNTHVPIALLTSAALSGGTLFAEETPVLPFASATFTEIVNDVRIVPAGQTQGEAAKVKTRFNAPDLVKTGRKSRAQLTADDGTVARVGSNAVFSFDKTTRTMNLDRGSVLFHSPTGKGGGAIVTNSATASVIGTTIIVTATSDGGFKLFVLEGTAKVKFANGDVLPVEAGKMTFVKPSSSGDKHGPVLTFDLAALVAEGNLVKGFETPLASQDKIGLAITDQNGLIDSGDLLRTGLFILGSGDNDEFFVATRDAVQQAVQSNQFENIRLGVALSRSLVYSGGPFPDDLVFNSPVFLDPYGSVTGVIAGHLEFNDTTIDLSQFSDLNSIFLLGAGPSTLVLSGSVDFTGLNPDTKLTLGGAALEVADSTSVSAYFNPIRGQQQLAMITEVIPSAEPVAGELNVRSLGDLSAQETSWSTDGTLGFQVAGDMSMGGGSFYGDNGVNFEVGGDLDLTYSQFEGTVFVNASNGPVNMKANNINFNGGSVYANSDIALSSGGDVNLNNVTLQSYTGDIKVQGVAKVSINGGTLTGNMVNIGGPSLADLAVANASITANSASIAMSAKTVFVDGMNFTDGSQVRLRSQDGVLNLMQTSQTTMFGAVNLRNVTYGANFTSVTDPAGVNQYIWIEKGASFIKVDGAAPSTTAGYTGTASSTTAPIHIQALNSPNQPGKYPQAPAP